ncbi:hypothetical protein SCHPADRAFT_929246 [Schizopora paradoxa]|uniref:Uncharacterized protein n=1 Tax=Schizopora paradoxa TaxID=27342 RepID=A0A0H2S6I3_9AGAM|nr:hypothetical protein SCHPADRAFT_929246 [Schizopora paradoxa]
MAEKLVDNRTKDGRRWKLELNLRRNHRPRWATHFDDAQQPASPAHQFSIFYHPRIRGQHTQGSNERHSVSENRSQWHETERKMKLQLDGLRLALQTPASQSTNHPRLSRRAEDRMFKSRTNLRRSQMISSFNQKTFDDDLTFKLPRSRTQNSWDQKQKRWERRSLLLVPTE